MWLFQSSISSDKYVNFISTWRTTSPSETVTLPLTNDTYLEGVIDWGDGSPLVANSVANRSHVYLVADDYTVSIDGLVGSFNLETINTSKLNLINIFNWGTFEAKEQVSFYNATNLDITASDNLIIDNFDFNNLFRGCSNLVGNSNFYNYTLKPSSAFGMFLSASLFNQPININGSVCTSFQNSFNNADSFNQPLINLVRSSCTVTSAMFSGADVFNQDLSSWQMENVLAGASMFFNATDFEGTGIGGWNTTKMATKSSMFRNATSMIEDLSGWDFSLTTTMQFFMLGKTNADYSTANMDALLNRLDDATFGLNFGIATNVNISFSTIDYTSAGATALASLISKGYVITIGNEV